MTTALRKFGWITGAAALLFAGVGFVAPQRAFAADASVAPSSCGRTAVPNTYCSFGDDGLGTGDGVVIGNNSCNVEGACTFLGIGATIGHRSCNGDLACSFAGAFSGSSVIDDNSCNN